MSKQSQANTIYATASANPALARKDIIDEIVSTIGCSSAYASTLYNNARKSFTKTSTATSTSVPSPKTPIPTIQKIQSFDRGTCRMVDEAIVAAMKSVEAQFGITIKAGGGTFGDNKFTTKLTITTGDGTKAARTEFDMYARMYGLSAEDFGKTFTSNGKTFKISGVKTRGKKYNILATLVGTDKVYKFGADSICRKLGK